MSDLPRAIYSPEIPMAEAILPPYARLTAPCGPMQKHFPSPKGISN